MQMTELGCKSGILIADFASRTAGLLTIVPDLDLVTSALQNENAKLRYIIACASTASSEVQELAYRTGAKLYTIEESLNLNLLARKLMPGDVIEYGQVRMQIELRATQRAIVAVYDLAQSDRFPVAVWPSVADDGQFLTMHPRDTKASSQV